MTLTVGGWEPEPKLLCIGGFAHGTEVDPGADFLRLYNPRAARLAHDHRGFIIDIVQETGLSQMYIRRRLIIESRYLEFYVWEKLTEDQCYDGALRLLRLPQPFNLAPNGDESRAPYSSHGHDRGIQIGPLGFEIRMQRKNRGELSSMIWQRRALQLKLCASLRDDIDFWSCQSQPWPGSE